MNSSKLSSIKILMLTVIFATGIFVIGANGSVVFVSGDVSGIWEADSVVLVDSVQVPAGDTLVITPGVEVFFPGYFKFYILDGAVLEAVGTPTDSIRFVPFLQGDRGLGLDFINASDQSILEYCYINDALTSGIHLENSNITVKHCLIENCEAPSGVEGGGAIEILNGSNAVIDSNLFRNNTSVDVGGAIYVSASSPVIRHNIIDSNYAQYSLGCYGGGIGLENQSNAQILNNVLVNNEANPIGSFTVGHGAGGAISCSDGSDAFILGNLILDNTVTTEPQTTSDAGAIFIFNSSPLISHNVFAGNEAEGNNGGAIRMYQSSSMIINNTFYSNTAGDSGGAFFIEYSSNAAIVNSILYANYALVGPEIYLKNSSTPVTYSNVEGSWPGEGNLDAVPMFRDAGAGDFHLQDSLECGDLGYSLLIDAGSPEYVDSLLDCNWGLGTDLSDMGAYGGGEIFVAVDNNRTRLPSDYIMANNFPNPFNVSTTIQYVLPVASNVSVIIYDELGRLVITLDESHRNAGIHKAVWDAGGFASGMYFYEIQAGEYSEIHKMILLK
jgi:hypothetical protein